MSGAADRQAAPPARPAPALPGDYHVHTTFSDGDGTVEECVAQAASLGLPEIAIADHVAAVQTASWATASMPLALMERYVEEVHEAAARHAGITVLLGLEAEYVPGHEAELQALLSAWPFEVVVLGVHAVDGFAFDDPDLRGDPRWGDADAFLSAYYRTVRRAVESGRFDVLAHVDYISLWGHAPGPTVQPFIEAALDALAASGAALELNTDRVTDPAGVMYPSPAILRAARERDIPLVIDSDAHEAAHVGRMWDEAMGLARAAGYAGALRLSDHTVVPFPGA